MDANVRAAAERWREFKSGPRNPYYGSECLYRCDMAILADAAIESHPADSDQVLDAERYRWFRAGGCIDVDGKAVDPPRPFQIGPEFDAMVDAAMIEMPIADIRQAMGGGQ